jgi:hypothetical protein
MRKIINPNWDTEQMGTSGYSGYSGENGATGIPFYIC